MSVRFYAPDLGASGDLVSLSDTESEHLTRVLRLGVGAAVRLFDGRGREFAGVVEEAAKSRARIRVGAPVAASQEPAIAITLAAAVLKGDKSDEVIRDAVMLGVAAIRPLVTERTETTIAALDRGRRRERWERIAIASAKQCGRAVVPTIHPPHTLDEALAVRLDDRAAYMLVEPGAASAVPMSALPDDQPDAATVFIGPEGGWTPGEIARAGATCRLLTLGGRTLRADAMPIVALTALFTRWGEL